MLTHLTKVCFFMLSASLLIACASVPGAYREPKETTHVAYLKSDANTVAEAVWNGTTSGATYLPFYEEFIYSIDGRPAPHAGPLRLTPGLHQIGVYCRVNYYNCGTKVLTLDAKAGHTYLATLKRPAGSDFDLYAGHTAYFKEVSR